MSTLKAISLFGIQCLSFTLFAQVNPQGYIANDTAYIAGKVTRVDSRRIKFQRSFKELPMVYTASQISEYGVHGNVYESLSIEEERRFLKRIASGKVKLFKYQRKYVLKSDNFQIVLTRKNFRSVLGDSLTCGGNKSMAKLAFSKPGLRSVVESSNAGKCNWDEILYRKIGIVAGVNLISYNFEFNGAFAAQPGKSDVSLEPIVGIFIERPIHKWKSFYVTAELNAFQSEPVFYSETSTRTSYIDLDVDGGNLLVGAKWVRNGKSLVTPFVQASFMASVMNVSSGTGHIESTSNSAVVELFRNPISSSSGLSYGLWPAAGIEIHLGGRKNIHLEVRYIRTFGGQLDGFNLTSSGFSFLTSFNF